MNDLDGLLATDYGFKPQGKSAPMAASKGSNLTNSSNLNFDLGSSGPTRSTRSSNSFNGNFMDDGEALFRSSGTHKNQDTGNFGDLFGTSSRYTSKSESRGADSSFNLDSMFPESNDLGSKSMNSPVYDKPVYDDDIFAGVPGLKSPSTVKFDDVFASVSSSPERNGGAFDDLLGGFGKADRGSKSSGGKRLEKDDKGAPDFDDLIRGFGGGSHPSDRPSFDPDLSSKPTASASKTTTSTIEDPFKVFESASTPMDSSTDHFTDPLEEISKFGTSRGPKNDSSSSSNGKVYDDVDPFNELGQSVKTFSSERNNTKDRSPPRTYSSTSWTRASDKEPVGKTSARSPERYSQNKIPVDHYREFQQTPFDIPAYSSDSNKSAGRTTSPPSYNSSGFKEANIRADMSPKYEENLESINEIWLTVSEVPLFTQPTTAPPPSRPPPPRPVQLPKSGTGSPVSTTARKKANDHSSFPSSARFYQGPKSAPAAGRVSQASQFDELEDLAMGRGHGNDDERGNGLLNEELEMNSAAAAIKDAMERAEAKFRHAREVREREGTKSARSKEAVQNEKDERALEEVRERQERLDRERQQKEREERERKRLEKEREREEKEREQRLEKERERAREIEREREKARQAVERATREARERAAVEARARAERAAVGKANAEARERAERAAVQRAQAEARERAAAEAKERAAAAQAEAEARIRAERAAVERAAAEARERAAATARMNQQKNEDDLESFFGMGTSASNAPKPPRANSSFPPNITRKSSGASSSIKKASSSTNIVDDLSSIFGAAPSSGEFQEVEGESEERRRARLERHQRAHERAAKALAEKNQRDLQTQREQAERHRLAETLDSEIKRWALGKEGNLRALLSTLQYVLWPECGWQPVSLTDLISAASVKKAYRKATLCIHPDKVQQKGANIQQKYIAEKVFDLLKEAWNKFNSEELF